MYFQIHCKSKFIYHIATGYGLDDRKTEIRVPVESRVFSSPHRPDRLWGPPSNLSNGYRGALSLGVPRSRKCGSIYPLPHTPSLRSAYLGTETTYFYVTLPFASGIWPETRQSSQPLLVEFPMKIQREHSSNPLVNTGVSNSIKTQAI
jgi:hypothetical protein